MIYRVELDATVMADIEAASETEAREKAQRMLGNSEFDLDEIYDDQGGEDGDGEFVDLEARAYTDGESEIRIVDVRKA